MTACWHLPGRRSGLRKIIGHRFRDRHLGHFPRSSLYLTWGRESRKLLVTDSVTDFFPRPENAEPQPHKSNPASPSPTAQVQPRKSNHAGPTTQVQPRNPDPSRLGRQILGAKESAPTTVVIDSQWRPPRSPDSCATAPLVAAEAAGCNLAKCTAIPV